MSDRELGPLGIIAVLTGVGLFGGRTGRAVLRRLRRLVAWAILGAVAFTVVAALTAGPKERALPFLFGVMGVILLCVLWCMIAFAAWLTRPEDSAYEETRAEPTWAEHEPHDDVSPHRVPWFEYLGVHPDDERDEIVAALQDEARDGETWYEAINVSPDATRREIVRALRREFEYVSQAIDEEIGEVVREEYGRPKRRR